MQPVTSGEGGFWKAFDWDAAFRLGEDITGLPYSGDYDFAATEMFWPSTHMVAGKDRALQCQACHSENGRMDWEALGFDGDPISARNIRKQILQHLPGHNVTPIRREAEGSN